MKVLVLNGSPKGNYSCTVYTSLFLEKLNPSHTFTYLNIGQQIKKFEKDMSSALKAIKDNDLIIFSYPVYTFIAPSQVHRFIELLKENNVDLSNKFVTQITTSKHFYDYTAHKYIEENMYDLNAKYIKGLSSDMDDLTKKEGQQDAINFLKFVEHSVIHNIYEVIPQKKNIENNCYLPSLKEVSKKENKEVVMVCDLKADDINLNNMIEDFKNYLPYKLKIVNIREFNFSGGCLGCFNCAGDGTCIYKDGFDSYLRNEIQTADAIVIAFSIKDHSMGARFKMYDDRQFCNGHRTVTEGMPFAYVVNGDYQSEENLRLIVEGRSEVGHNYLAGVGYNKETIIQTINKLEYAIENSYVQPRNFLGVGGMKIFRDLIYVMRGLMKADHIYYKKHGVYDFPQKQKGRMLLMCLLGSLVRNKKIKTKMGNKMNEGMVQPYKKVLENIDKNKK